MLQQDSRTQGQVPGIDAGFNRPGVPDPTVELLDDPTDELLEPAAAALSLPAVPNESPVGTLGGRYLLEERVARGGTAIVSRARDLGRDGLQNHGHIAIKLLRPELRFRPQSIARLQREFRQTRLLGHPNVVRHFDIGCDQGRWFIAMELLEGEALGQRLKAARPHGLPPAEAIGIAAACGDALAAAHDRGVTHGDIKPDNVFVTATNGVRLLDFGAAPDPTPQECTLPAPALTPAATRAYASPEVLAGQLPEPRDDVFSLACVIYEMLAGRHPYGRVGADQARDAGVTIERPPGLTSRQWLALAAALAWQRDARPAQVRDLLLALAPVAPAWQRAWVVPGKRVTAGLAAVIALLVALAILALRDDAASKGQALAGVSATAGRVAASNVQSGKEAATPAVPAPAAATPSPRAAAPPRRRLSFGSETLLVSRGAVSAAIPIRIEPGSGRVSVSWRVIDGSAIEGRDFGGPKSGIAVFQEGQTDRILYVPIFHDPAGGVDRSFAVELTRVPAGARLGEPRRAVVTIQGN